MKSHRPPLTGGPPETEMVDCGAHGRRKHHGRAAASRDGLGPACPASIICQPAHDPEKCAAVFPRDKREKRVCAEIMRKRPKARLRLAKWRATWGCTAVPPGSGARHRRQLQADGGHLSMVGGAQAPSL